MRPPYYTDAVKAALDAATGPALSLEGDAADVVLAFLDHMCEHYVGDYYIEGALGHLAVMVRDVSKEQGCQDKSRSSRR